MKKRLAAVGLALALALSLTALPASASETTWRDAYKTAIRQDAAKYADWGIFVSLVDFDGDGTPELLISSKPGSGLLSEILYAATYKNGALVPLSFREGMCNGSNYTLYRNDSTGARKIEATLVFRSGYMYHAVTLDSYWLSGKELHSATAFVEEHEVAFQTEKETVTYYIGEQKVSKTSYDSAYNSRNSGWTEVKDFQVVEELYGSKAPTDAQLTAQFAKWKDSAPVQSAGKTVSPTAHSMTVDGKKVDPAAYTIDGNNFFKLRDVAAMLSGTEARFQLGYNEQSKAITLTPGQSYTAVGGELSALPSGSQKAVTTPSAVYVDGKQVSFTAYNINGNNYFKLRDLGQALGFYVGWDDSTRTVIVDTARAYDGK